jgi:dihydroflavonol-4-reductase
VLGSVGKNEIASEDHALSPRSSYDESKLEGERCALQMAREGLNILIIRPGWVYGPGDRRTFKLIKAIDQKKFVLVTKGKTWQTPIYIEDLIKGILLCAEKGKSGEIYNLSGGEVLSVREIVETIAAAAGKKIPPFFLPLFPAKIAAWIVEKIFFLFKREAPLNRAKLSFFIHPKPLSIKKAEKELGFSPLMNFRNGMDLTLKWYREHNWL